jgi:hypothetical protein
MRLPTANARATQAARPRPARLDCETERLDRPRSNGESPSGEASAKHGRRRPGQGDIDQVAVELIARRGREILATARRYASNRYDAEDAYQRRLETRLAKAPTTQRSRARLRPRRLSERSP